MTTTDFNSEARQARIAARVAARSQRPDLTNAPRCTIKGCANLLHRAGRCEAHWLPMRKLVGAMMGANAGPTCSRRAISQALTTAGISVWEWEDAACDGNVAVELDRFTDQLFAAGYRIAVGPRGGRYLVQR
jgi:hypothetical protein